jgi:hypothetical protein
VDTRKFPSVDPPSFVSTIAKMDRGKSKYKMPSGLRVLCAGRDDVRRAIGISYSSVKPRSVRSRIPMAGGRKLLGSPGLLEGTSRYGGFEVARVRSVQAGTAPAASHCTQDCACHSSTRMASSRAELWWSCYAVGSLGYDCLEAPRG